MVQPSAHKPPGDLDVLQCTICKSADREGQREPLTQYWVTFLERCEQTLVYSRGADMTDEDKDSTSVHLEKPVHV